MEPRTKPTSLLLVGAVSLTGLVQAAPTAPKTTSKKDEATRILIDAITRNASASRDEARELLRQSELLAAQGNYKAAMDKRIEMLTIRCGENSFFGVMTADAIQELALSDLGTVATHLDAKACRFYAHQMKQLEARKPTYVAFIRRDKADQLQQFASLSRTPQAWQKFITDFGFGRSDENKLRSTPVAQIKANIERLYNLQIRSALKPYSNTLKTIPLDPYTYYATQYSVPKRSTWARYQMKYRFAIAALEDRADHLQHRTPKAALPADSYGTGPFKRKANVIYSVGPDTKDDGGKSVPQPNRLQPDSKGDVIMPRF